MYKKYKNKLNFVKFLRTQFNTEIRLTKISQLHSRSMYYVIDLEKLWGILLTKENYVNNHVDENGDQKRPENKIDKHVILPIEDNDGNNEDDMLNELRSIK